MACLEWTKKSTISWISRHWFDPQFPGFAVHICRSSWVKVNNWPPVACWSGHLEQHWNLERRKMSEDFSSIQFFVMWWDVSKFKKCHEMPWRYIHGHPSHHVFSDDLFVVSMLENRSISLSRRPPFPLASWSLTLLGPGSFRQRRRGSFSRQL